MKTKNFFYLAALILFLNSCVPVEIIERATPQPPTQVEVPPTAIQERPPVIIKPAEPVRTYGKLPVAVILPLSGKNAKIGQSMLNAINMSLFDNDQNNSVELSIFDDKSNEYSSKKIMDEIISKNIKLVIGPIFTNTIEAIAGIAAANDITLLSFSNNSSLANKKGVFLAGFAPEQEIDRITSYLIENGHTNFAVIAPNNQYGIRIAGTLRETADIKDANFISSQFYIDGTTDFSKTAATSLNSFIISKNIQDYQDDLNIIKDKGEREAKRQKIISNNKLYPDTILITESSNKVFDIAKEIQKNNVEGRDIKIIGTGYWNKDEILIDPVLNGAIFPAPDNQYFSKFKDRYLQTYNEDPTRISSIAYDITAFVIDLTKELKGNKPTANSIVNYNGKKGYNGIDGTFRFLPNGMIERNLAIIEINGGEFHVIEKGSRSFLNY